ncbi:hypothetical protein EVAR_83994_1 [Eumeta japonica]|uniref:Uncharacterized protein n=1 Tax=Eumeta variegata TaxID=151549 RepID=A0A4C1VR46_EUMVA|nr:hypothetical protein EVAR_83994_1 [Eumeta japonica]
MPYTNEVYADMHLMYELCEGNARRGAARRYARRHPQRHHDYGVFLNVHPNLTLIFSAYRYGSWNRPKATAIRFGKGTDIRNLKKFRHQVLELYQEASISLRRILRRNHQHRYHL